MSDFWHALVERILPWYSPSIERVRNARTARVVRRSTVARARAERVIAEYRAASKAEDKASDNLIEEARRDD